MCVGNALTCTPEPTGWSLKKNKHSNTPIPPLFSRLSFLANEDALKRLCKDFNCLKHHGRKNSCVMNCRLLEKDQPAPSLASFKPSFVFGGRTYGAQKISELNTRNGHVSCVLKPCGSTQTTNESQADHMGCSFEVEREGELAMTGQGDLLLEVCPSQQ